MEQKLPTKKIPAFFKPFVAEDRQQRLKIPFAFSTCMEGKMPTTALLRDRNGSRWPVTIAIKYQLCSFEGGWRKFVEKNNLQLGDFLIFQYDGKCNFDFIVLGSNACEKKAIVRDRDLEVMETDKKEEEVDDHYVVEEGDHHEDLREEEAEAEDDDDDDEYVVSFHDYGVIDDYYVISDDDYVVGDDVIVKCDVVDDGDYNTNYKEEGQDYLAEETIMRTSATACMIPTGRRSYDYVRGEGNKIFESGKVERPKVNPYFVAKLNPFRTSDLYVPVEVIKNLNLKLSDTLTIRDEEGRVWTVKVNVWKDGGTWLAKGWKPFCRWNKVNHGDMCLCEFVPMDDGKTYILQIKIVGV